MTVTALHERDTFTGAPLAFPSLDQILARFDHYAEAATTQTVRDLNNSAALVVKALLALDTPDLPATTGADLTIREHQILHMLADGQPMDTICRALFLSEGRVRNLTTALCAKLGAPNKVAAIATAFRLGILETGRTQVSA